MSDSGTLEVVSDRKVTCAEPMAEATVTKEEHPEKRPARKVAKPGMCEQNQISPDPEIQNKEGVALGPVSGCSVQLEQPVKEEPKPQEGASHHDGFDQEKRYCSEELHRDLANSKTETDEKMSSSQVTALDPELLKPMKKRKRKDYASPSEEESEIEAMEEKTEDLKICSSAGESKHNRSGVAMEALPKFCHAEAFFFPAGPAEAKKEQWSWSQFLEEQRAMVAPPKLFQEVRSIAAQICPYIITV
ncbi:hypothetical protein Z043_113051 [Scleropages formosus]|uniref:Uncharacterized protein n=1 Tax=Scleropages formosus TaxID=113540 RepID=A0A0P7V1T3_SCLFO|nr:hypothetical protein Z043_113051 [Scleropages formosus]